VVAPVEADSSAYPYQPQSGITPDRAATHFEPLITLAHVAGMTHRIRLGTTVLIVPIRNPVYTAKLVATLDALSGGRVILGVGVGWMAEEFRALDAPPFAERGAVTDEYLRLYRSLWRDEISAANGTYYTLPAVRSFPKPAQRPGPPLWVGGHSRAAMRRALAVGDGWHPVRLGPRALEAAMADFRALAEERGRDLKDFAVALRCDVGVGVFDADARDWQLFGSPARVAEGIGRYRDLGCTDLMVELHPRHEPRQMLDALERFAEVARRFQDQTD
jgi:probable F420-dependent oxidoreductase